MQEVLATTLIVSFFVLNARQERSYRQRRIDPRGVVPIARVGFLLGKVAMVLGWLGIVVQAYFANLRIVAGGPFVSWLAVSIETLGIGVIAVGYRDLGDQNQIGLTRPPLRLRNRGIYRVSRNPVYFGFHLVTIAAVLYTLNPVVVLLGAVSIAVHHAVVLAEEVHLERELGAEYREYQRAVRRYL